MIFSVKDFAITACLFIFFGLTAAAADDYPYTQSYVILINNEIAGTETVAETKGGSGEVISTSEHELLVSNGMAMDRMIFSTRMVLSKGAKDIKTYVCQYKTGQAEGSITGNFGDSYEVSIQNGQITRILTRNGQSSEIKTPLTPNMVIVDFNVYHQYEYLVRRYDRKKKGTQTFANFIPVIGNDIPLKMTWLGDTTLSFDAKKLDVSTFRAEFTGIQNQTTTFSVDKNGRLAVLENPAQKLKVIRKDLNNF